LVLSDSHQAASAQLGHPLASLEQQLQTLLLLLPDLEGHFKALKGSAAAWQGVLKSVQQLQPQELDRQELVLMAQVMATIR
jgi:hypothetical protein